MQCRRGLGGRFDQDLRETTRAQTRARVSAWVCGRSVQLAAFFCGQHIPTHTHTHRHDDVTTFRVVKWKNRFASPVFNGYHDCVVSVRVRIGLSDVWHVCEVQLHMKAIFGHSTETRVYYEYFRDYFEGAMETVDRRLADLRAVMGDAAPDGGEGGGGGGGGNRSCAG